MKVSVNNQDKQENILVFGHKNPDTDSICSAIAYCELKNRTVQGRYYVPKRCGQISEETEYVLNRFGVRSPSYTNNVGPQIKDMDITPAPDVRRNVSIKKAWDLMKAERLNTLLITDREGHLEGLVTLGDISSAYMGANDSYLLSQAKTSFGSIAETIKGEILNGDPNAIFRKGKVVVSTAQPDVMKKYVGAHDLVIMGDREEDHLQAIRMNVGCIVTGINIELSEQVKQLAKEKNIVLIRSKMDSFNIARVINLSIPVGHIMITENLITFSTSDYADAAQETCVKYRHSCFPVINKKGRCLGTIRRRNFMDVSRKKVVLVDHNEIDQAVENVDKADILEIIDHHKLGTLQTRQPLHFRNEPVGCTATIIYQMYGEQRLDITPKIAGLLCAAIISDTLMFRSPTCTLMDKMAAGALALIADIKIDELATEMFTAGSNLTDKSPEEIFYSDYKKFALENDVGFSVGQISSMNTNELQKIKDMILPCMNAEVGKHGITRVFFMLTSILDESTELLYCGEGAEEMIHTAFGVMPENGSFRLKGVVSRKKQLIPPLMDAASQE